MAQDTQPLPARLALIGAVVVGLICSLIVGPQLFPAEPGGGLNVARIAFAAAGGAAGAAIGWLAGKLLGGSTA